MPAGYSGTPLVRKLGIKAGHRVALIQPPEDFSATLGELPDDVSLVSRTAKKIDIVLLFVTKRRDLERLGF